MSRDGMHGLDTGRCLACECAIFRPASCEGWWICGRCADAEQKAWHEVARRKGMRVASNVREPHEAVAAVERMIDDVLAVLGPAWGRPT